MSKILAIKGDKERGNEVIALLEMLGGYADELIDNGIDEKYAYFIVKDENNVIDAFPIDNKDGFHFDVRIFTLEEFLENYPFKVGDVIKFPNNMAEEIAEMKWDEELEDVIYTSVSGWTRPSLVSKNTNKTNMKTNIETPVRDRDDILFDSIIWHLRNSVNNGKQHLSGGNCEAYFRELVKKVKENDMENCKCPESKDTKKVAYLSINDKDYADEIEINLNDDYEYKFEMNRLYILKKKPVYPKTYEECCKIMYGISRDRHLQYDTIPSYKFEEDLRDLLEILRKLIICRKAYWKIAGEQMGLDKPWEPKYEAFMDNTFFTIQTFNGEIDKSATSHRNSILAFPTIELRDAFYENFKDLIEKCKEFL